jgi:tRNA(fMet)-specific endonuclease VapC
MPGRLLLDTSFVVDLFHGDASARQRVADADEVFLAAVALGELYYGAERATRRHEVLAQINSLAASVTILPCDPETAPHYGVIKHRLRSKGRPLPENDIWIAAVALQHDLAVATRDAHFLDIEGLTIDGR